MDLEILKIASKTDNIKIIDNYTHFSKYKNKLCGDLIEIHLIINNNIIKDFAYQTKSCVLCQASASLLSKAAKNKSIKNIKHFHKLLIFSFQNDKIKLPVEWSIFKKLAKTKYYARKECIELPFKALNKATMDNDE